MATPMTAVQVVAQLKKWGIRYVEIPGWATHNRNSKGAWGPVNGFIWHHTGAAVSAANAKSYAASTLYNGLADLPGPSASSPSAPTAPSIWWAGAAPTMRAVATRPCCSTSSTRTTAAS